MPKSNSPNIERNAARKTSCGRNRAYPEHPGPGTPEPGLSAPDSVYAAWGRRRFGDEPAPQANTKMSTPTATWACVVWNRGAITEEQFEAEARSRMVTYPAKDKTERAALASQRDMDNRMSDWNCSCITRDEQTRLAHMYGFCAIEPPVHKAFSLTLTRGPPPRA
ncbi:hypothetical protein SPI_03714 [Niveomyces insectorum RCEF 264]|uniref:Uncharacterized protein n=1 Tax=Niveomyces insectorum RCEF 264 TaxID=1081102 RepID=A0A167WAQ9_9HYPO|nr:hypothetical protein SPI_03714 [Niveomyces insectorum RCEF 264]